MIHRRETKKIQVGNIGVGGDSPITVQSMTNTITADIPATVAQIHSLEAAGCDIIRCAINDEEDAVAIREIKRQIRIPLIADIQFDHRLGLYAVENGCDCLRINPGNIGSKEQVIQVVERCKEYRVPIRIGVNSGSIHREILQKYGGVNTDSLVESALQEIRTLEELDFYDIKISIKSSNVVTMIEVYQKISELVNYPLHLGVTEAGPARSGSVKSSIGIGTLLYMGIGDTIRVSLTTDPVEEIRIGREILRSLGLLKEGVDLISCPTCSRTKVNLIDLVQRAEERLATVDKNLSVAIMGCPVNGPGEAKEADLGIACTNGYGVLFKKGKVIRQVEEQQLLEAMMEELDRM